MSADAPASLPSPSAERPAPSSVSFASSTAATALSSGPFTGPRPKWSRTANSLRFSSKS